MFKLKALVAVSLAAVMSSIGGTATAKIKSVNPIINLVCQGLYDDGSELSFWMRVTESHLESDMSRLQYAQIVSRSEQSLRFEQYDPDVSGNRGYKTYTTINLSRLTGEMHIMMYTTPWGPCADEDVIVQKINGDGFSFTGSWNVDCRLAEPLF